MSDNKITVDKVFLAFEKWQKIMNFVHFLELNHAIEIDLARDIEDTLLDFKNFAMECNESDIKYNYGITNV